MASIRQTVVNPLGLVLTPNTYGQYPAGALSKNENIVMRAPGELWAAPSFGSQIFAGGASTDVLRKLYPLDSGHIYTWTRTSGLVWSVNEAGNACTLPTLAVTTGLFSDGGQIFPIRARERMLVNTQTGGVFVGDNMAPTNGTERALRSAGLPQPLMFFSLSSTNAGTIPNAVTVGYAALIKRVFSDGYQVISVPSPVQRYPNYVGVTIDPIISVKWPTNRGVIAGDIIEIYRTDGLLTSPFDINCDPGEVCKLIHARTLTATDITNTVYQFTDVQSMPQSGSSTYYTTSGRALYTNEGQEGPLQVNRQPDICNTSAKYKSYAFYGDLTERPSWTFQVPSGYGDTGNGGIPATAWWRLNGIGARRGTGTVTNGSPTITAISAAEMVGLAVGQSWGGGVGFAPVPVARIITVGATSVTLSQNANANAAVWVFFDQIQLDGVDYPISSMTGLLRSIYLGTGGSGPLYEITADQTLQSFGPAAYTTGVTITLEPTRPFSSSMTIAGSNGQNYQPAIPSYGATPTTFSRTRTPNLLRFSKTSEPEHVPPSNDEQVGTGTILSMVPTKNALWIFCSDGLYRLSGDVPPWRVDWVDPNCILTAPQATATLRDEVWAYTNYGIVAITDSGVGEVTAQVLDSIFPGPPYASTAAIIVEKNELDDEVLVYLGTDVTYVFNTKQKAWSTLTGLAQLTGVTAIAYQRSPASGNGVAVFGVSTPGGGAPTYSAWTSTNFLTATVAYQPWYGDDAMSMKQFIDLTHVFNVADAGKIVLSNMQGVNMAQATLVAHNSDSYATCGMTRAYAIAQSIAPGFTVFSQASQFKFKGLSIRFVPTTNQAHRQ